MAGEIGASVIVVKEIEVERSLAELAKRKEDYRERRGRGKERYLETGYSEKKRTGDRQAKWASLRHLLRFRRRPECHR